MKKTILIDVDDVICENHFLKLANKFLKKSGKPVLKSLDGLTADYEKEIFNTNKERQAFNDLYIKHNSYKGVKPIKGSVDAIETLTKKHDVYFVTSCVHWERQREFSRQYTDKFKWLLDNFPFFPPDQIIMTNKKQLIKADVIIDDRLKHLSGDYKTKILFTSFHNKGYTDNTLTSQGIIRANGWQEILEILNKNL